ncbi:hypothetical protein [Labilibacter marinus]|uniref:hypothetical protein n=1 Tax=Labilibacter marinus TaxID=1477105 RepID=UPI00094F8A30|nr:hypothetical protein [Labilibacter marinus]
MKSIYLGNTNLNNTEKEVKGEFVIIDNEKFYKINNYDKMPDFFMSIVSDSDHWMFISSNGSLSAGRKNRDNALFPYYTDDKIHDYKGKTGSNTILLVDQEDKTLLWQPFIEELSVYQIERNLYKNIYGNKIIFEEINYDLGIAFKYEWSYTEKFGFVKQSQLSNITDKQIQLSFLDGIKNILPYGIDFDFQNTYSNLLDAYKKNELLEKTGLGLFMLSSIPVDRAEPSESLKTTTVWSHGLADRKILLSDKQVANFKKGCTVETEIDIRAARGAYYLNAEILLNGKTSQEWMIVAEINQDSAAVANLNTQLGNINIVESVKNDIQLGTENLIKIVSDADGLQLGNDTLSSARHFSNTMFNVMRGGIFNKDYKVNSADFKLYVGQTNKQVLNRVSDAIDALPVEINYPELCAWAMDCGDVDLLRIANEYLPLTFSRRHGDPSRPWNQFAIETKNEDGSPKLNYQGNWRDIFQNWEALAVSYPEFVEGMISKFVNASTADGYNPYRITREGIDWECPDPEDPWAYIGYWGDHQIIYLQKFLELSKAYHPGKLNDLLAKEMFVYANVPYRIKSYKDIVANPQDTITFDVDLNTQIKERVADTGADARMLWSADGELYKVNLSEKILVTLLSKLSNFIPEAGIWLNTQRPEWNDANNALVGNGVSMVTLYYIRRFLKFWSEQFAENMQQEVLISEEVVELLSTIHNLFDTKKDILKVGFSDEDRRHFADVLGLAGEKYRNNIYKYGFSGDKKTIAVSQLVDFANVALSYMDQSINANKRSDGLYHSYNLISFAEKTTSIRYLYEMLEGQVAVLSSGYLNASESLSVLDALKASALFREDQYSYILYPDRQLARFEDKNTIPTEKVQSSALLSQLVKDGDTSILKKDLSGAYHLNGALRNADVLKTAIDDLDKAKYAKLIASDKNQVLDIYEEMFDHQSFTGRSGTFYGYEGLGSIYWHMVSKLLLATQESYFGAIEEGANAELQGRIKQHYYEIKAGIGIYKSPELYGAFPTDAYSHSPGGAGAKQPGMTGQVKEDVIARLAELGVSVKDGKIHFNTALINHNDVLTEATSFEFYNIVGERKELALKSGQLAYTFCKVPVVYTQGVSSQIEVLFANGKSTLFKGNCIDTEISNKIFNRLGEVSQVKVVLTE